jgi:hypothetical protein
MNNHTPGPWSKPRNMINDQGLYVADPSGNWDICTITLSHAPTAEQAHANARLIAAAPAMLDALAYVVNWHREHDSGEGELFGLDYVTTCLSALRQADPDWHTTTPQEATKP